AVTFFIATAGRQYSMHSGRLLRQCLQHYRPQPRQRAGRKGQKIEVSDPFALSEEAPLHVLIWMLVGEFTTTAHVTDWLETLKALPPAARQAAMAMEDSHATCIVVAESLTAAELGKPKENRDWPAIVTALTDFAARAREMRCEVLWAAFIRAKLAVQ